MVDTQYLVDTIKRSGLKKQFIADKLGCTRQTFSNKLETGDFKVDEANKLSEIFGYSATERNRVFFTKNVTANSDKKGEE